MKVKQKHNLPDIKHKKDASVQEVLKIVLSKPVKDRLAALISAKVQAESSLNVYMQALLDTNGCAGDWNLDTTNWVLSPVVKTPSDTKPTETPNPTKTAEPASKDGKT